MRRRRKHLEVSTFPFLAVLLCAMGALILVLLSMDRKARLAALARGQEQAEKQQAEYDREVARRLREHEGKKWAQQQAWQKKRDALRDRVHTEEEALDQELRRVQARLAQAAHKLRAERDNLDQLGKQFAREKAHLAEQESAVTAARRASQAATTKLAAGDQARARLAAQLLALEQSLKEWTEARQRDGSTYSVIPYRGKRGESRRPVYVECTAAGVLFHPDREALPPHGDLRGALRKRLERQQARLSSLGVKDLRPYIMLLVRPDGLNRYYEIQAAARDLGVEFGYEFVDADWVLQFPDDDADAVALTTSGSPSVDPADPSSAQRGTPGKTRGTPLAGGQAGVSGGDGTTKGPGQASGRGTPGGGVPGQRAGSSTGTGGWGTRPGIMGFAGPPGGVPSGGGLGSSGGRGGAPGAPGLGWSGAGASGVSAGRSGLAGAAGVGTGLPGSGSLGTGSPGGGAIAGLHRPLPFGSEETAGLDSGTPGPAGTTGSGTAPATGGFAGGGAGTGPMPGMGISSPWAGGQPGAVGLAGQQVRAGGQPGSAVGAVPATGGLASAAGPGTGPSSGMGTSSPGMGTSSPGAGGQPGTVALASQQVVAGGQPGSGAVAGQQGQAVAAGQGPAGPPQGGPALPGLRGPAPPGSPEPPGIPTPTLLPTVAGSSAGAVAQTGKPTAPDGQAAGDRPARQPTRRDTPGPYRDGPDVANANPSGVKGLTTARSSQPGGGSESTSFAPPPTPAPRRRPVILRPARLNGDGESFVFVECRRDVVVVYPGHRRVAIDALNHSPTYNPLFQTIRQQVERRQAQAGPGETARVHIRFLIHRDGERTFHLAYPVLEGLAVPKTRYSLQPEDDVSRIVTQY
jgi:hypothetical protein